MAKMNRGKVCLVLLGVFLVGAIVPVHAEPPAVADYIQQGDLAGLQEALADWLTMRMEQPVGNQAPALQALLADDEFTAVLTQYEVVRSTAGAEADRIIGLRSGKAFFWAFLGDRAWMEQMTVESGRHMSPEALHNLYVLWCYNRAAADPFYRRVAAALAYNPGLTSRQPSKPADLAHTEQHDYGLVWKFRQIRKNHRDLLMHKDFDMMPSWEMERALSVSEDGSDRYYLANFHAPAAQYGRAPVPYRGANIFGDSIHRPQFYPPWQYRMSRAEMYATVGGVCGAQSRQKVHASKAHGIPASTVGSASHCGFWIKTDGKKEWMSQMIGPWGKGTLDLMQASYADWPRLRRAEQAGWLAALCRAEQPGDPTAVGDVERLYVYALRQTPTHLRLWQEYGEWAAQQDARRNDVAFWKRYLTGMSGGMGKAGGHAAWNAIDRILIDGGILPSWSREQQLDLLVTGYARIPVSADYAKHAALFVKGRNRADAFPYFEQLVRSSMESGGNMAPVMTWANQYFRTAEQKEEMYAVLARALDEEQAEAYSRTLYDQFVGVLREAAQKDDYEAYNTLQDQARELLRPASSYIEGLAVRRLKTGQMKHQPTVEPFAGTLVSQRALVRLSAPDARQDKPLLHREVVSDPGLGGFLMTRAAPGTDEGAWVRVGLKGPAELSGIVLVACWEQSARRVAGENGNLRVSLSGDGREWTEVARIERGEKVMRIPLNGELAQFVKVEKVGGKLLSFRNILVYGRANF